MTLLPLAVAFLTGLLAGLALWRVERALRLDRERDLEAARGLLDGALGVRDDELVRVRGRA